MVNDLHVYIVCADFIKDALLKTISRYMSHIFELFMLHFFLVIYVII
jgi:hypothetical protein